MRLGAWLGLSRSLVVHPSYSQQVQLLTITSAGPHPLFSPQTWLLAGGPEVMRDIPPVPPLILTTPLETMQPRPGITTMNQMLLTTIIEETRMPRISVVQGILRMIVITTTVAHMTHTVCYLVHLISISYFFLSIPGPQDTDSDGGMYGNRYEPSAESLAAPRIGVSESSTPTVIDYGAGREQYPAWTTDRQIPLSKEEIEDIFLDLTQKFGFQRDSMRNMARVSPAFYLFRISHIFLYSLILQCNC
jgi:hypothetical protein